MFESQIAPFAVGIPRCRFRVWIPRTPLSRRMASTMRIISVLHASGAPMTITGFGDCGRQRMVSMTPQSRFTGSMHRYLVNSAESDRRHAKNGGGRTGQLPLKDARTPLKHCDSPARAFVLKQCNLKAVRSVESSSSAGLRFGVSSFDPRQYHIFRKSDGAAGAIAALIDDTLGRGEPDPTLLARRFSERRFSARWYGNRPGGLFGRHVPGTMSRPEGTSVVE